MEDLPCSNADRMLLVGAKAAGAQNGSGIDGEKSLPSIEEMSKLDQEKFRLHMRLQAGPPSEAFHNLRTLQKKSLPSMVASAQMSLRPSTLLHAEHREIHIGFHRRQTL